VHQVRALVLICIVANEASAAPRLGKPEAPEAGAAEAAARDYVSAHPELGVRADDLVVVANRIDGELRSSASRRPGTARR
jgi:hypothetical protein